MKNDDFLGQGHSFDKWVIVGHWPVTLYHPDIQSAAPILLPGRRIASIDGGCVLKLDGQLNALILPGGGLPGLHLDGLGWTAHRHGFRRTGTLRRPSEHPLGPQRCGGAGAWGGAVSLPPFRDGADPVHLKPISAHRPQGGVVRGLHRLSPARVPRGRIDPGGPDENRFFVQKRRGDGVVLWPPVRYNINSSNGGLTALHPLPGWAEQINIDRLL